MHWWENLSDSQLLKLPLKELDLDLKNSPYFELLKNIETELKNKNIKFKSNYWIATEFFVLDGGTGIALPFYLLHPRLIRLEKKFIGFAEGENKKEFCKIMRHEYAHALDNAFYLRRSKKRRDLFGDPKLAYPNSYLPKKNKCEFVEHLSEGYAQSHPDEDFAETFAVWLKGGYEKTYTKGKVSQKLSLINEIMTKIAGTKPVKINKKTAEGILDLDMTLGEYLINKAKERKLQKKKDFFITLEHKMPLNIVKKSKKEIIKSLANDSKYNEYIVEKFLNDYLKLTPTKGSVDLDNIKSDISIILTQNIQAYRKKRFHRIIM